MSPETAGIQQPNQWILVVLRPGMGYEFKLVLMSQTWPFDQLENAVTLTTRQVVSDGLPVLSATHFSDDDSWAFTCGTTASEEDAMVVAMHEVVGLDPTLHTIADLPPGWRAHRAAIGAPWVRVPDPEV
jgi:hypothetical protein